MPSGVAPVVDRKTDLGGDFEAKRFTHPTGAGQVLDPTMASYGAHPLSDVERVDDLTALTVTNLFMASGGRLPSDVGRARGQRAEMGPVAVHDENAACSVGA